MTTPKTAYICELCRQLDNKKWPHPGQFHTPGICDCPCRDEGKDDDDES